MSHTAQCNVEWPAVSFQSDELNARIGMFAYSINNLQPENENAIKDLSKCMDGATFAAYKEILMVINFALDFFAWKSDQKQKNKIVPCFLHWDWLGSVLVILYRIDMTVLKRY